MPVNVVRLAVYKGSMVTGGGPTGEGNEDRADEPIKQTDLVEATNLRGGIINKGALLEIENDRHQATYFHFPHYDIPVRRINGRYWATWESIKDKLV